MSVAAVIVAGGSGLRAGGTVPKQYQLVGGKPVIRWALEAFRRHPQISHVQTVIGEGHEELFRQASAGLGLPDPVVGGGTRQESCHAGIESCASVSPDSILIHDAARPFLSQALISVVINGLDSADAVVPGLPVADTMKFAPRGIVDRTVDRASLWFAQTPQGFRFSAILEAHRKAARDGQLQFTDDAAVAEYANIKVRIVAGEQGNRKITTQQDFDSANRDLAQRLYDGLPDVRTGQGVDYHVFGEGNAVTLCGVRIPHSHCLKGHSDADVALHALTDALLGSIGERDIGQHFPPHDPQWKDAPSSIFLAHAFELLKARGGGVANVDITILAETPRIAPYIGEMKSALAGMLQLSADRIGIKATTTEGMGAIGRKEGICAQAIATVRLPA
jgi:2-C-methyl-D-erythritol 4-phosphate cytidylyltransferase / 2-C-methyl-D-erythritol 2,4-cyclodiphosphate synthase